MAVSRRWHDEALQRMQWVHAGSILNEATTHLSVAIFVSQCALGNLIVAHHKTAPKINFSAAS